MQFEFTIKCHAQKHCELFYGTLKTGLNKSGSPSPIDARRHGLKFRAGKNHQKRIQIEETVQDDGHGELTRTLVGVAKHATEYRQGENARERVVQNREAKTGQ